MSNSSEAEKMNAATGSNGTQQRTRAIHSCNFRYAGRLSNENARSLTALHEKFAVNVTNSLELYLGSSARLKLISLEQMAIQDYVAGISPNNYLLPSALNVMENNFLLEIDIALVCPIIDLLLGGTGTPTEDVHELTEIDEEIVQSVSDLIVKEVEHSWKSLNISLTPAHCIKPNQIPNIFPVNEKLVLLMFEMTIGETPGPFNIVLPTSFVGFLLRHLKASQSKKMSSLHMLRGPSLRERILDCDFTIAADIAQMRVLVMDLVELKPGTVLKMKAPVKNPGRLTVEDVEIFEAVPVRNGRMKAAQLAARSQAVARAKVGEGVG
jgi:flagellar motor switch protein FliM